MTFVRYGRNSERITHHCYHVSAMKRSLLSLSPENKKYFARPHQERLGLSWSALFRKPWTSLTASVPSLRAAVARLIRCLSKNVVEAAESAVSSFVMH